MTKPQPPYTRLNFNPKDLRNGRNRRPASSSSRRSDQRAGNGAGAEDITDPFSDFTLHPGALYPAPTDPSLNMPSEVMQRVMDELSRQAMHRLMYGYAPAPTIGERFDYSSLPTDIVQGEIESYRFWLVSKAHYLHSFTGPKWEPRGVMVGDVNATNDRFFHRGFRVGVFSYKSMGYLLEDQRDVFIRPYPYIDTDLKGTCIGLAIGKIKSWGEVIEHEFGYRSSFAKIISIDGVHGGPDLSLLRSRYFP